MSKWRFIAMGLALAGSSYAQTYDVFQLNYYSNRNSTSGADQIIRIVNSGEQGSPLSTNHGTVCADLYVFDANQVMIECCSCRISGNGLLELSVLHDLTANPLTGLPAPNNGVVGIVSDNRQNCDETSPVVTPGLTAWGTHLLQPLPSVFVTTETKFLAAPLSEIELGFLGQACAFVQYLGSGKGTCTCGTGDGL
jgi:hypothetical protein